MVFYATDNMIVEKFVLSPVVRIAAISAAECRKLRQVNADNFGT